MTKKILFIIFIFIIGIAGGIFSSTFVLPNILGASSLELNSQYLAKIASGPINITEKKEITVQENIALQSSIKKIEKSIVGILSKTKTGQTAYGSGLILTSDGVAIALSDLVPRGGEFIFYVDGDVQNYQILKRDESKNLVLLKFEGDGFQPCGFANFQNLNLGERVFLAGINTAKGKDSMFVNEGVVRFFNKEQIKTNILEENYLKGSSLFDIKGELLGLNIIDKEGKIEAIPITFIREFAGF